MSIYMNINIDEIISLLPSYYTESEKKEISLLLIDLANIYLDTQEE